MTSPTGSETDKDAKAAQDASQSNQMDEIERQKIGIDLIKKALYGGGSYKPQPAKNGQLKEIGWDVWMSNVLVAWSEHFVREVGLGLDPCPKISKLPTEEERESLLMWNQMDQKAKTIIQQGLSMEHIKLIQGARTSHEMYRKLARNFAKDAQLSPAMALSEVCVHKWDPQSSTFDENLQYIQGQIEDLRQYPGTKEELIDLIQAVAILNSLPPEWESIRSAIYNTANIELENVILTARRHAQATGSGNGDQALAIKVKGLAKAKGKAKKGKTVCENCKKTGHTKASCWSKGGGNEGGGPNKNKFGDGTSGDTGKESKKGKSAYTVTADDDDDDFSASDATANVCTLGPNPTYSPELSLPSEESEEWLPFPTILPTERANVIKVAPATPADHSQWVFDTGASASLTGDRQCLHDYQPIKPIPVGGFGTAMTAQAIGKGRIQLRFKPGEEETTLSLGNVLYVPEAACNIISASRLLNSGLSFASTRDGIKITHNGTLLARATRINGQFILKNAKVTSIRANAAAVTELPIQEWHLRFGHLGNTYLRKLIEKKMVEGLTVDKNTLGAPAHCRSCAIGKMARQPFPKSKSRATRPLELVHSDLAGPQKVTSRKGYHYILTITDDATRFTWVYFLPDKGAAPLVFQEVIPLFHRQYGYEIKIIRTDRGGEFLNQKMTQICRQYGIVQQTSNAHTPQQNGVAERLNRTLADKVRCIYADQPNIPAYLWPEVFSHVNYLRNLSPTSALAKKTPYEALHGSKPNVLNLRPFWDEVIVHIPAIERASKLSPRGRSVRFIGFPEGIKGILYYDPKSRKVSTSRDFVYPRDPFASAQGPASIEGGSTPKGDEDDLTYPDAAESNANKPNNSVSPPVTESNAPAEQQQQQQQTKKSRPRIDYGPKTRTSSRLIERAQAQQTDQHSDSEPPELVTERSQEIGGENSIAHYVYSNIVVDGRDPLDYREATAGPNKEAWMESMRKELNNMERLHVYELTELPPGRKAIGCKWVFKTKRGADGEPTELKSRLVAQGFTQKYLIDYNQVHAPVARTGSIKLLATIAVHLGLKAHQLDVKAAFLHGELSEEIYMRQPPGFEDPSKKGHVLRLKKSIYGLKQSGRVWNQRFDKELRALGFSRLIGDPCVYIRRSGSQISMLGLHVDDMEFFCSTDAAVPEFIKLLGDRNIELVHVGPLTYMLGVKFTFDYRLQTVGIDQHGYIDVLLTRFGMNDAKPAPSPFPSGVKLTKDDCPRTDKEISEMKNYPYHALIGSLLYLTVWSRPDLAYHVNALAQFSSNPGKRHWELGKHVLRFLKHSRDFTLILKTDPKGPLLTGYADADWGSSEGRRSTTGYAFTLGSGAVTWQSKKQPTVALSSAEAEYMALSAATQEALWLRSLLSELGFPQRKQTTIYSDNLGAISLTEDSVLHQRVKHIDIRHHFIRDHVTNGSVKAEYLRTEDQPADALTKALPKASHSRLSSMLGVNRP